MFNLVNKNNLNVILIYWLAVVICITIKTKNSPGFILYSLYFFYEFYKTGVSSSLGINYKINIKL